MNLPLKLEKHMSGEAINALPLWQFGGKIVFVDNPDQAVDCMKNLRTQDLLGFDTETRPAFRKGQHYDPAIVQIATDREVFVFQLAKCKKLAPFLPLFESEKNKKVCLGVQEDVRHLKKIQNFNARGFVDLTVMTDALGIEDRSLRKLCAILLKIRISKREQTSDWSKAQLTEGQLRYAATDAWVSRQIYEVASDLLSRGVKCGPES
jgi:ribonuclease D